MLAWKLSEFVGFYCFFLVFVVGTRSEEGCTPDLLRLFLHQENPSIQLKSLKNQLRRIIHDSLTQTGNADDDSSVSKRNLEALARAGYIRTLPEPKESDTLKRSLAILAKNGDLNREKARNFARFVENKRNVAALLRRDDYWNSRKDDDGDSEGEIERDDGKAEEKRFLGRLPRLGKPRTTQSPNVQTRFYAI